MAKKTITTFTGDFCFLSNFWPVRIQYDGLTFPSVEHAYQAAKTGNRLEKQHIAALSTAAKAKGRGGYVHLRHDWENVKTKIMLDLVRLKFVNPELRKRLLATGDAELIEGNWWHDTFWGTYRGVGRNELGQILMRVRKELRQKKFNIATGKSKGKQ